MVLDCNSRKYSGLAEKIAASYGAEICPLGDTIRTGENRTLFSGTPYVLVTDFSTAFSSKFIKNIRKIRFTGSRILYVVFACSSYSGVKNSVEVSKSSVYEKLSDLLLRNTGLVMFGYDCIHTGGDEAELLSSVSQLTSYIRDMRPLDWNGSFPKRAEKKVCAKEKA